MENQKVANMQTGSLNRAVTREKLVWDNGDNDRWGYWDVCMKSLKLNSHYDFFK